MKTVFYFVIAILVCSDVYAQHKVTPSRFKADQKILNSYIYQLNKELVINNFEGDKSKLTKARISSLISESRDRYTNGTVSYSPDGAFKIFVIKGEMVGAHINCVYAAFIHSTFSTQKQEIAVSPIDHILKIGTNKYLIIQRESTCGGTVFYDYRKATVISFVNGKLTYFPFYYKDPTNELNTAGQSPDGSLILEQLMDMDNIYNPADSILLKFDPKTNKLEYRYRVDYNICCDQDKVTTFSGFFHWENGRFIHKTEHKKDREKGGK